MTNKEKKVYLECLREHCQRVGYFRECYSTLGDAKRWAAADEHKEAADQTFEKVKVLRSLAIELGLPINDIVATMESGEEKGKKIAQDSKEVWFQC